MGPSVKFHSALQKRTTPIQNSDSINYVNGLKTKNSDYAQISKNVNETNKKGYSNAKTSYTDKNAILTYQNNQNKSQNIYIFDKSGKAVKYERIQANRELWIKDLKTNTTKAYDKSGKLIFETK